MNLLRSITAVFLSLALLVGTTFVESEKSYANQDPNGEIQEVNEGYIQGWAHDPDLGNIPVEVKIYIDGKFYTNTMADIPFHSLTSSGLTPTSEHGFIVRFNNYNFTPGSTYQITAYALDNSTRAEVELSGSPVPLTITGGGNNTTTPNAQINVRGMNHYTNDLIPLDATSSTTTDHQTFNPDPPANLTFSWTLTTIPNNSTSTLSSTTDHTISFTPDLIGDYTIELIVTDPANNETDQTSTTITATSSSVTTVPNPINFVGTFDAELDTVYTSNANVISGFTGTVNATAGGGINTSIIKNGFDTGSTSVMIGAGDAIALKSTSSPLADTLQTITLTIGSSPTQWQLKTAQTPVNTPCIPDSQTWNTPGQHNFIHTPGCDHLMFEAWGAGANGEYQTYTVSDIKNYKYNLTVGDPQASPETLVAQDDLLTNNQITILEAKGGIDPKATTNPNGIIIATWSDTPPVPTGGSKPSKYKNLPEIIYHHSDHLGSSSIDTDETGAIVELIDYYPFGTPRLNENPGDYENDYKFTGKELDEDTDLYYYGARYYDAKIGRFVAIDPVALKNPTKVLSDPQQLNTYSYTRNNPLKYVDPEGEMIMLAPILAGVAIEFAISAFLAPAAYSTNDQNHDALKAGYQQDLQLKQNVVMAASAASLILGATGIKHMLRSKADDAIMSVMNPIRSQLDDVLSSSIHSPNFIVTSGGEAISVPDGAHGPFPADNGNGMKFIGGQGGAKGNVDTVRIMNSTSARGNAPAYPDGYAVYETPMPNSQAVNSITGQTLSPADAHISFGANSGL